ncbi:MAG TPA: xanthine dehydrogenase molybdopterin binding subunit, partial [Paraburkholderia sp.]
LMTHAPSTYKIPAVNDTPAAFNVSLYRTDNAEPTVFRSKAVGEPPLLLSFSVFLAIRDAIAAAVPDAQNAPALRAPATPEAILDALDALRPDNTDPADPTKPATIPAKQGPTAETAAASAQAQSDTAV